MTFRGDLGFHFEPASEFCKCLTSTHCGFGSVLLLSGQLTFSPETQQLENKFSLGCNCSDQYLWRQHHLIPAQTTGLGITVWFFQELFHLTTYQPDCRPQSTNCGIGSEELPGLSIVCRRYGGFQSPSFCADWSFATTLRILQYILTHCAFGGPTNCRVGSCYRLTGQLVPPLHTTGLGTLSDCPIQGLIFHFNREGWAPLFWLAWRNFLHEPVALCDLEADTTTTHRGPIHHGWQLLTVFSFVWRWIHFSWWQILSFWIGLALLLAKGALELHWLSSHFCIFPESACEGFFVKKQPLY